MDCTICEDDEVKERVVLENVLAFAFLSNMPIVPGHALIAPKRHVARYDELDPREKEAIEDLRERISVALREAFGAEGFNFAWNEGKTAGQSFDHFHLHIVPRKRGDAGVYRFEPREFLYRTGSRAVAPAEELIAAAKLIRAKTVA